MNSEINQEEQDFGIEIHTSESTPLLPLANGKHQMIYNLDTTYTSTTYI